MTPSMWFVAAVINVAEVALLQYFHLPHWTAGVIGATTFSAFLLGRSSAR